MPTDNGALTEEERDALASAFKRVFEEGKAMQRAVDQISRAMRVLASEAKKKP